MWTAREDFGPGQVSVAVGHVRCGEDMTVLNFRPGLCPPHPPAIPGFYGTVSASPYESLKVCRIEEPTLQSSLPLSSSSPSDHHEIPAYGTPSPHCAHHDFDSNSEKSPCEEDGEEEVAID